MRVGVVGINHKQAELGVRELLAKTCQKWFGPLAPCHLRHQFILLSTCNRTEIYFSSEDLGAAHSYILNLIGYNQKYYSFFGLDCFYHLSRVTAGMDSAIIWESEIQKQVKNAYEEGAKKTKLPKELHFIFQKALHNGKLVRSRFQAHPGLPDLEHTVFSTGFEHLKGVEKPKVLFVGASAINLKILSFLKKKELTSLTLCNRSEEKGIQFAKKHGCSFLPWEKLSDWHLYDWVIYGTRSPTYLLKKEEIGNRCIMDLSVPRNVDPRILGVYNIDALHQIVQTKREILGDLVADANSLLREAISRQRCSLKCCAARHSREWDNITNILHPGNVLQESFESYAEAGVGNRAVFS